MRHFEHESLDLPNALRGKIAPDLVLSIDPAQVLSSSGVPAGEGYSYVRTNLTVLPYAVANNLPYKLAANFEMLAQNPPQLATVASQFFFFGGEILQSKLLVGWEHDHIPPTINALLQTIMAARPAPNWPDSDYDTIWTAKLDAHGNVTVSNATVRRHRFHIVTAHAAAVLNALSSTGSNVNLP